MYHLKIKNLTVFFCFFDFPDSGFIAGYNQAPAPPSTPKPDEDDYPIRFANTEAMVDFEDWNSTSILTWVAEMRLWNDFCYD